MADVQTEHGYVKVANRLVEAILDADFTGAQVRILLVFARLTYGWRRRTASLTVVELAALANLSPTGGFRRAFHELIQNGVVLELKEGRTTTYAIQKDFVAWGRFGGNERKLALRWDARPKSDDALLKHMESTGQLTLQGQSTDDASHIEGDGDSADDVTPQGHEPPRDPTGLDPVGSTSVTPQGEATSPYRVNGAGAKSLFDETVEGGKDRKDRKDIQTTATAVAPAVADEVKADATDDSAAAREYAIRLSVALNRGITARWGERLDPVKYSTGLDVAKELIKLGVDLDIACTAITAWCANTKKAEPPSSVRYVRGPILEAFELAEQRALNAADPSVKRGGAVRAIGTVVNSAREQAAHDLRTAYDAARRDAAVAWGKDPENASEYREIVATVKQSYAGFPPNSWVAKGIAADITKACCDRCQFPDYDTWATAATEHQEHGAMAS